MEIAKLILEYLSVLVYPSLILLLVLLFKKELKLLLDGKLTAKYKDLILTIEKQKEELDAAESKVDIVRETIQKASVINNETKSEKVVSKKEYDEMKNLLNDAIGILKLSSSEMKVVSMLKSKPDKVLSKGELINFHTKGMDYHGFGQTKMAIEKTLDDLVEKNIISINNGNISFTRKALNNFNFHAK
jgi:hypothetical protein